MKKILIGLVLILGIGNVMAEEINIKVNGMVCSMCAQGIKKKFSNTPEVKKLDVDMDEKTVKIETHEGKNLSDETITSLIKEAGYNVAEIKRK